MDNDAKFFNEHKLLNTPVNRLKQSFIYKYLKFTETKVAVMLKHLTAV